MTDVYLFDWGDTLMVDFPGVPGKMCNWETVAVVEGAEETLNHISKRAQVYVATGAADSTEAEIELAFNRVGLDRYITGYFCKSNLGLEKGTPEFLSCILSRLGKAPSQLTMVGDNFNKDIKPALTLGMNAVLLSKDHKPVSGDNFITVTSLRELCF